MSDYVVAYLIFTGVSGLMLSLLFLLDPKAPKPGNAAEFILGIVLCFVFIGGGWFLYAIYRAIYWLYRVLRRIVLTR